MEHGKAAHQIFRSVSNDSAIFIIGIGFSNLYPIMLPRLHVKWRLVMEIYILGLYGENHLIRYRFFSKYNFKLVGYLVKEFGSRLIIINSCIMFIPVYKYLFIITIRSYATKVWTHQSKRNIGIISPPHGFNLRLEISLFGITYFNFSSIFGI
jgi:hypothetical protein